MTNFFRSISLKIFGVSLGLLAIMAAASLWSASLTEQVHLQLRTINQALFPLTLALADLDDAALDQEHHAETALDTPDMAAVQRCLVTTHEQGREAAALVAKVEQLRAEGARIAVLDRNKVKLAQLQPMFAELKFQEDRLYRVTVAACAIDAPRDIMAQARANASDVRRMTHDIAQQLKAFVAEGAVQVGEAQTTALRVNLLMIASAALVGLMLAWLVARGLTRPIVRLQAGARAVSAGQLDAAQVRVTSKDEIGDVTQAFNIMVDDLREKERIKQLFGQYVDPRVVAGLIGSEDKISAGERQVATLFFSDIAGFASVAQRLSPSTLVNLVNAYFSEMSQPIQERLGIIDKYIGDAIMAFWVPPFVDADAQAALACAAALDQFARLDGFRAQVPDLLGLRRDIPLIDFRAALATGEVVVGSIGSSQARSFTVMGDTVNFASRLENANKYYGTRLLIDERTRAMAGDAIVTREVDWVGVVGRDEPAKIHELCAMAGDLTAEDRKRLDLYAAALAHYRLGKWDAAVKGFKAVLAHAPDDGPSRVLLDRIAQLRAMKPGEWDGVWRMTSK